MFNKLVTENFKNKDSKSNKELSFNEKLKVCNYNKIQFMLLALSKLIDTYDIDEPLTRHMRRETIRNLMDY